MIVYKITNIITNKSYIGKTRYSLEKRYIRGRPKIKKGEKNVV